MRTELLRADKQNINSVALRAAELLNTGEVVAIPTETVYGLAASIYSERALKEVYAVKGRPQDNPVIVHISNLDMLEEVAAEVPEAARKLADRFWPGPLTMVFRKTERVSDVITCGLGTVAVRYPSHPAAMAIIEQTGAPLAAPSANLSGRPSPTTAEHCVRDLWGKVPLIVDGGPCDVGVESTVISLTGEVPVILRPGIISLEDVRQVLPDAVISEAVMRKVGEDEKVESPGLKYKHYSPNCDVTLVRGSLGRFVRFLEETGNGDGICAMCFEGEEDLIPVPSFAYGKEGDGRSQAHNVFYILRELDDMGMKRVYVRAPLDRGRSLAVSNRLTRAAGFKVLDLGRMTKAALTGPSGSGKSLLGRMLEERGIPVIDCDRIVREIEAPGEKCLEELVSAFGEEILREDGELDRKKLASVGFADEGKKELLNSITHKYVLERVDREAEELDRRGEKACVIEAGALLESGLDKKVDLVILVTAPEGTLLKRIRERDGITEEQALARLRAQTDVGKLREIADLVFENDGDTEALGAFADRVAEELSKT